MPDDPPDDTLDEQPLLWPPAVKDSAADSGTGSPVDGEMQDEPGIEYPQLVQEALRDVARLALSQVARDGLPGEHHFFISFKTTAPGVHLPPFLLDLHPEEMTIVLQEQFWDLVVDDEAFSVSLAFGGSRHSLTVPFSALSTFVDPSVPFGLRWQEVLEPLQDEDETEAEVAAEPSADPPSADPPAADSPAPNPSEPAADELGKVVRFDRSRADDD